MNIKIVTGMSGAGKSRALTALEDMGYYCVDNMPVALLGNFVELGINSELYQKVALVIDIRTSSDFKGLFKGIDEAKIKGASLEILFLDSTTQTLIKRYKETRRKHPLMNENVNIEMAIEKEKNLLEPLKNKAEYIVDTSSFSTSMLREHLVNLFAGNKKETIMVNVLSFGFKHGTPNDADIMFDVRFLPNPYYEIELREKTGMDKEVEDYVFESGMAGEFFDKLTDMVDFLLPRYIYEGKTSLVIGIGCTGGKHRSVTIARLLAAHIRKLNYNVVETHRDYKLR